MDLRLSRESQLPHEAAPHVALPKHVVLSDGQTLRVAAIAPSDEAALRAWFERLSPDSRYHRFHAHVTKLTDQQWRYLTHVDGVSHIAIIAWLADQPVGVARLILQGSAAEIAFLVDDKHQRCGIGSILRDLLLEMARSRGIYRLHAHVLPSNVAIRRLFDAPSVACVGDRGDVIEVVLAPAA